MGEVLCRIVLTNVLLSFGLLMKLGPYKKRSGKIWSRASYNFHSNLKVPKGLFYILVLSGFFNNWKPEGFGSKSSLCSCRRTHSNTGKKDINCRMRGMENILTVSFFYQLLLLREDWFWLFYNVYICWAKKKIYYLTVMFLNLTPQPLPFFFFQFCH